MGTALSSWKEIAHYIGKGVRTVQRWERESGLPVRRPQGDGKGKVLAFPAEIDQWMHSAFMRNGDEAESEVSRLQARVEQLVAENQKLRHDLNAASRAPVESPGENGISDESLLLRCAQLLEQSARTRQRFSELLRTHSAVAQACADTVQTLKGVQVFRRTETFFHDAD